MNIKKLMRAVRAASVELRVSGDDIVADGVDRLPAEMKEELDKLRRSRFLWSWCGADDADLEAIEFAEKLGVDPVLVEDEEQARDAIRELGGSEGCLGLDIETALKLEFAAPRPPIAVNVTGALSAVQPTSKKPKKSDPKPWADPNLTDIKTLQLFGGKGRCFVFRGAALATVLQSSLLRERQLVAHSAQFETSFLRHAGVATKKPIEDTMQACSACCSARAIGPWRLPAMPFSSSILRRSCRPPTGPRGGCRRARWLTRRPMRCWRSGCGTSCFRTCMRWNAQGHMPCSGMPYRRFPTWSDAVSAST